MSELKIRTRNTGALAVMLPGSLPTITTPTGGTIDVVTQVSAPGFNPLDLLYASLAACMVLSARIAATRLGVADRLGEVRADVGGDKAKDEASRVETFTIKLEITGDLDAATKERILADAEDICTVSNTLRGGPALHATLG
ncbi:OsmC family peroxiredoxin [Mesorhizobium sp. M2D.F.Ca.ET.185.01.1.1]|uniref:OsmC family protein n=1 Tax=unclassified Mesorhizobium TaxID=325217 RepID=UPI000FCBCC9C|nr:MULTISPECIES: OsmC family protein [unclassified Mesorhizobium]TGP77088.1 OsmC family peroxiredoxin [bacterium M00.F.Ca.ET.227.01.1.1]TGP84045.1 OsmC family peroxiredoxin [bacterium M00.F.Ca.ET.221.01.1.1]TGP88604.1 OsmC family peroxiredoxin [bacterium M00.F.Ca.ET.222.01.1.1]TGU03118.1 OsmC family peroxiredoxin [bacterium M00.F.Ca.ET.163.01.1.1]TGU30835.1 OsmC family peroxiredoxin [bacterium M00.F.Ca.ET.156.01.1.1]TGU45091.1 OsmC family peroxiredoxin [bacterium M00.F.Ca.ET.146.01.1.1]TGV67